jgi:predicted RNA-binding Zn-ribbon protein involved in translation (DUF1610 family)
MERTAARPLSKMVKTSLVCKLCGQASIKRLVMTAAAREMGFRKPSMTLACNTCGWTTPGLVSKP